VAAGAIHRERPRLSDRVSDVLRVQAAAQDQWDFRAPRGEQLPVERLPRAASQLCFSKSCERASTVEVHVVALQIPDVNRDPRPEPPLISRAPVLRGTSPQNTRALVAGAACTIVKTEILARLDDQLQGIVDEPRRTARPSAPAPP